MVSRMSFGPFAGLVASEIAGFNLAAVVEVIPALFSAVFHLGPGVEKQGAAIAEAQLSKVYALANHTG